MNTDNHGNKSCKLTQREGASRYPTACTEQLRFVIICPSTPFSLCSLTWPDPSCCVVMEVGVVILSNKLAAYNKKLNSQLWCKQLKLGRIRDELSVASARIWNVMWLLLSDWLCQGAWWHRLKHLVQSKPHPSSFPPILFLFLTDMTAQRSCHTRLLFAKYGQRTRDSVYATFVELAVSSLGGHRNTTCSTEETTEYPQHHLVIDWGGGTDDY